MLFSIAIFSSFILLCYLKWFYPYNHIFKKQLKKRGKLIFAHISGQGVKWKHKGIYLFDLEQPNKNWTQLVKGDTGKYYSISENGKTIAWAGEYAGVLKR